MEDHSEGEMQRQGPSSIPSSDPSMKLLSNKKHQALLQRLSQKTATSSSSSSSSSVTAAATFLSQFTSLKSAIESQLSSAAPEDLSSISVSISSLENLVAENSYHLPAYDLRACLKAVSELKSSLQTVSSEVVPKKKFSFRRNKQSLSKPDCTDVGVKTVQALTSDGQYSQASEKSESNITLNGGMQCVDQNLDNSSSAEIPFAQCKTKGNEDVKLEESLVRNNEQLGFRNRKGELLVMNVKDQEVGEFTMRDLESCEVRLIGSVRTIFVHRLRDCKVYTGPVMGSILIEEAEGCTFIFAAHQIRIHGVRSSDFYLRVRSKPIIEDCTGVRFAPYCLRYDGVDDDLKEAGLSKETGSWAMVDDFKWLRAVQSPNWSVLPENQRIESIDA
ncbi:hypothetical protein MLD38_003295 [Melastoma candidum]|uniref:Uncharacterized protein n=1 Tax=Melastoma candidum TaxID=119954 RepID=A0ACB9S287_9MYRT|nr:hypothetical protein MLD38_003295 [Melastoma candidum]